jgi:hypothetical protein
MTDRSAPSAHTVRFLYAEQFRAVKVIGVQPLK